MNEWTVLFILVLFSLSETWAKKKKKSKKQKKTKCVAWESVVFYTGALCWSPSKSGPHVQTPTPSGRHLALHVHRMFGGIVLCEIGFGKCSIFKEASDSCTRRPQHGACWVLLPPVVDAASSPIPKAFHGGCRGWGEGESLLCRSLLEEQCSRFSSLSLREGGPEARG